MWHYDQLGKFTMVSKPIDLGWLVACLGSIDLLLLLKLHHRLHISTSWVKIRLHTKNQLPRLPGSALKVPGGGWVGGGPTHYHVTPN